MNISFVNYTTRSRVIDYAWLSFKSYVEDNYKGISKWNWNYPIHDSEASDVDQLVDRILIEDPTLVGFSVYVWNAGLSRAVARRLKELRPDIYIMFGGPYSEYKEDKEYFRVNSYIDFTCQTDGYGEVFLNELLYQIETDHNWMSVPFMVRATDTGYEQSAPFAKRSFVWPKRIFERNLDYLSTVKESGNQNIPVMTIYETHRGCPYKCSFCEWSGGINSKVSFKSTEEIIDDLTWLSTNGYLENLHLVEANFGQLDRDVQLIEMLCDMKAQHGSPKYITIYGLSKSKKKNVYQIDRLLGGAKLAYDFKISIQDLEQSVLDNIHRVDESWSKQFDEYELIRKETGVPFKAELIRGLPGSTIDNYYSAVNVFAAKKIPTQKYPWHLLPTSPAASASYMSKFKLETIDAPLEVMIADYTNALEAYVDTDSKLLIHDPRYILPSKIVVGSYSYTREEYAEMMVMDSVVNVMEIDGYLTRITQYLQKYGILHSEFYQEFYRTFRYSKHLTQLQSFILNGIILQAKEKVNGKVNIDFDYYRLEGLPWNITARGQVYINLMINLNRVAFYKAMHEWIGETFGFIDKLDDLIVWSMNYVKWIDYDPSSPVSFITQYDWTQDEEQLGPYENTPKDLVYTLEELDIDWHKYPMDKRVSQYFLKLCSLHNTNKMFQNLEVTLCQK